MTDIAECGITGLLQVTATYLNPGMFRTLLNYGAPLVAKYIAQPAVDVLGKISSNEENINIIIIIIIIIL